MNIQNNKKTIRLGNVVIVLSFIVKMNLFCQREKWYVEIALLNNMTHLFKCESKEHALKVLDAITEKIELA